MEIVFASLQFCRLTSGIIKSYKTYVCISWYFRNSFVKIFLLSGQPFQNILKTAYLEEIPPEQFIIWLYWKLNEWALNYRTSFWILNKLIITFVFSCFNLYFFQILHFYNPLKTSDIFRGYRNVKLFSRIVTNGCFWYWNLLPVIYKLFLTKPLFPRIGRFTMLHLGICFSPGNHYF